MGIASLIRFIPKGLKVRVCLGMVKIWGIHSCFHSSRYIIHMLLSSSLYHPCLVFGGNVVVCFHMPAKSEGLDYYVGGGILYQWRLTMLVAEVEVKQEVGANCE